MAPGIWLAVCGFPSVKSYLRQLKLEMATRLKIADSKPGRIFRGLYGSDKGSFERDVEKGLQEWLLNEQWWNLSKQNITLLKKKIRRIAKKSWPENLNTTGMFSWLYHNHQTYSGNVPSWADWKWPGAVDQSKCELHFSFLLAGLNPAGGNVARCRYALCRDSRPGPIYSHHFFECNCHMKNRVFFRNTLRRLYREGNSTGSPDIPLYVIDNILKGNHLKCGLV